MVHSQQFVVLAYSVGEWAIYSISLAGCWALEVRVRFRLGARDAWVGTILSTKAPLVPALDIAPCKSKKLLLARSMS